MSYIKLPISTNKNYQKTAIFINSTEEHENEKLLQFDHDIIQQLFTRQYLEGYDMIIISHIKHKSQSTKNIALQLVEGCQLPPDINDTLAVNKIIKEILNDNIDNKQLSMFTLTGGNLNELVGNFKVSHYVAFYF